MTSNPAPEAKQSTFTVETPRDSDAIAAALRETYDDDMGLPEDMAAILHQLNGRGSHRTF